MGTTLTGTTPQTTYDALIKVGDNGPLSGTAKYLSDGLGNDSVLALSTSGVGIGTTSLLGDFSINNASEMSANFFVGGTRYAGLYADGSIFSINSYNSAALTFSTSTGTSFAERMRITSTGNVGIGTSSPTEKLDVIGGALAAGNGTIRTGITYSTIGLLGTFTSHDLGLITNGTEKIRITSTGNVGIGTSSPTSKLVVNGDIATSGNIALTGSGAGIFLGGSIGSANGLDDYEEGTWTMGVAFGGASTGVTYITNAGAYTKVGRQVTVSGYLTLSSKGSSTGNATITGLPFTIANGSQFYAAASVSELENVTFADVYYAWGNINSTNIILKEVTTAGVSSPLTDANFANNSGLMISLTYFV